MTNKIYERSSYLRSFLVNSYGKVAEIFHHSLNVEFGEHYLHIGGGELGLTAFGISLPMSEVLEIITDNDINNMVMYRDGQLIFYGNTKTVKYNLIDFLELDLKIVPQKVNYQSLFLLYKTLNQMNISQNIGININYIEEIEPLMNNFSQSSSNQLVKKLHGYGRGLTPSGDDMLVGMLMIFTSVKGQELAVSKLKNSLVSSNISRTTNVSENYINSALDGYISEDLKLLSNNLNCNNSIEFRSFINKILLMGHTSGHDTMMGIYLALMMILGGKKDDR